VINSVSDELIFFLELFEKRRTFLYELFQKRRIFYLLKDTLKFDKKPKIQTYSTSSWTSLFGISEAFFILGMCCQEAGQGDMNVSKEICERVVVMTSIHATNCNTLQRTAPHCSTGASRHERVTRDL